MSCSSLCLLSYSRWCAGWAGVAVRPFPHLHTPYCFDADDNGRKKSAGDACQNRLPRRCDGAKRERIQGVSVM
ncbi:MAG: hypothetical protein GY943_31725 [Chloroflexi bacterium]|nr:hypothetical protein [Chloroflexota bacterium]